MTLFFYGANVYALRQQVAKMAAEYRKRTESDFGLERVDGSAVKLRELTATLQAAPFLASSRLVIVEGLSTNKEAAKVAELLEHVPSSTVAVFVEPAIDRRTTAFKELGKADRVMEFKPLMQPQLVNWVIAETTRQGGTVDRGVAIELVELVGDDQWRLSEELNKLVNFNASVSRESVRELVVAGVDRTIFELVDAMTAGRVAAALEAYHNLLAQRENELYILTMIQWQLRNLLWAVAAPAGITQPELAKVAGLSPFVAGKAITARKRLSETALAGAYIRASETEFEIKTGRTKAEVAVEQLIYQVAEAIAAKR